MAGKAMYGENKPKIICNGNKIKKGMWAGNVVYSAGNIVTYHVDSGITYQEEVDSEASYLEPKTFTPTKNGWTFVGWREDAAANGTVTSSKVMGDSPVTLYAVFLQTVTVTYYNNSTSANSTSGYRYYNNGNTANPSFTLTQAASSGWAARGWSTSNAGNAAIAYNNGATFTRDSNVTLYGLYQQTITLATVANGSTTNTTGTRYWAPAGSIDPTFTVSNPSKSGATFQGWSSSASSTAITNSAISSLSLSASTTRYAVFKYTNTSVSVASRTISIGWKPYNGTSEETITLYTLDTSKYESLTVTASVGLGSISHSTSGDSYLWIYMCGTAVRLMRCPPVPNNTNTTDYSGTESYPGYNGKTFTLTHAGNLTFKWKTSAANHVTDFPLNISGVTLNGKTVVG